MVETMANQFTDKDSLILRTDTSEMFEDESVEIVKQIEDQTRGSVKTVRKLSDITPKGSPTNIWHPEKNTFFIFNKHPVQESLKTLQEVLPLRNDCAWFSCLYINCQAHDTWKSESHIITVSKWVLRQKWNADVYVALHSRNTDRDYWFIILIPVWSSSSLSQAFLATIYIWTLASVWDCVPPAIYSCMVYCKIAGQSIHGLFLRFMRIQAVILCLSLQQRGVLGQTHRILPLSDSVPK